ncbi:hypothetical protein G8759_10545 [Spirosoma aureum]|uniref:Lipocalin-like domain-containing protein n=1 Tax=Spirosoma aureum TaxID=2692134 RepID=A0A6G9ALE7_9BACT|nr:lipocalin family protein [Spirosoma aureum]QIP13033.1 hypothetical protein G8759_10545 [Spirosoma aureum]
MTRKHYLLYFTFLAMTLAGCSKSDDSTVTPTDNNAELLIRKWTFSELTVKTDAKLYVIPPSNANMFGDDNTVTINKDGTYSYLEQGKQTTGKWTLTDKTLALIDTDKIESHWTVNTLSSTALEIASVNVNVTKTPDNEGQTIAALAYILLTSLDNFDFMKEPQPKSLQLIAKAK